MSISFLHRALGAIPIAAALLAAGCASGRSPQYHARLEAQLLGEGKLRTETTPAGVRYSAEDLIRNFSRIALHHESDVLRRASGDNPGSNPVKRWEGPLRYTFFGKAVTPRDEAEVARLMRRIAALTRLDIARSETGWNFLILITTPEERAEYSAVLARIDPGLAATFDLWRRNPALICVANDPFSNEDGRRLSIGMVAIGSETGGVLRQACLHEEITQSLGLANDHPDVRPSIFNDDGEFALLTGHDEYLLRILYDPRLRPGMTAAEAMPIVREIVAGLPVGRRAGTVAGGGSAGGPLSMEKPAG